MIGSEALSPFRDGTPSPVTPPGFPPRMKRLQGRLNLPFDPAPSQRNRMNLLDKRKYVGSFDRFVGWLIGKPTGSTGRSANFSSFFAIIAPGVSGKSGGFGCLRPKAVSGPSFEASTTFFSCGQEKNQKKGAPPGPDRGSGRKVRNSTAKRCGTQTGISLSLLACRK